MNTLTKPVLLLSAAALALSAGVALSRSVQETRTLDRENRSAGYGVPVETRNTFDALNRVTNVTKDSGHDTTYGYDPAGNITSVKAVGRSSTVMQGEIVDQGNLGGKFTFEGEAGEPVTLRLEAVPREAGIGKFAELKLNGKTVVTALPVELTDVLPKSGKFVVRVKKANPGQGGYWGRKGRTPYLGPYDLTLEGTPRAAGTFGVQPEQSLDEESSTTTGE